MSNDIGAFKRDLMIYFIYLFIFNFSVSLRWSLRFEFTIGKSVEQNAANDMTTEDLNQGQWLPSTVKTETMLWDLPLHVVATNPIQASLMMQAKSLETLILPTTWFYNVFQKRNKTILEYKICNRYSRGREWSYKRQYSRKLILT